MLKITENPEFTQKVKVRVPVDGGFSEQEFTARFRVLPWSELTAIESDPAEQLRRVWVDWDGIVDDDSNPIPFSDAERDRLIEMLFVRTPCLRTYVDAVAGAKRGN